MKQILFIFPCCFLFFAGCGKEFLNEKRETNQVIPNNINDYQAILDNSTVMNKQAAFRLVSIGSDEYIYPDDAWETLSPISYFYYKNGYIWTDDVYEGNQVADWNNAYQVIMYANLALDIKKLKSDAQNRESWKNIQGQALFHRAFAYYQLAQAFCRPYAPATAKLDKAIPLRLDYDVTVSPQYGSLEDMYDKIISDLLEAASLLPETAANNYRPSRLSSYALLSRIFREMDRWDQALEYSEKILSVKKDLLDYNKISGAPSYPFDAMKKGMENSEILFYCQSFGAPIMSKGIVSEDILRSYEQNDLRKALFFKNGRRFYGSYAGSIFFNGLALDEIVLIRAEAYLKKGLPEKAKDDLEFLLSHRYRNGDFGSIASEENYLRERIYAERIKELYMRGTRWSDIRKQNLTGDGRIVLTRQAGGKTYTLQPDDPGWVWQWPDSEKNH